MFGFSKGKNLVGLDIGSSAVKVVELKDLGKGRGYQLLNLALERLSPEAIVDGAIMDAGLVVDTVDTSGMSVLMVTHNVAEAIGIADRLLLVSRRPASLIADVPLDRPRRARDRAWAEATRADLAARHPEIIAL